MDEYQPSERWLRHKEQMKKRAEARGNPKPKSKTGSFTVIVLAMFLLLGGSILLGANILTSLDSSRSSPPTNAEETTNQATQKEAASEQQARPPETVIAQPQRQPEENTTQLPDSDRNAYARETKKLRAMADNRLETARELRELGSLSGATELLKEGDRQLKVAGCLDDQQDQNINFYVALSTCESAFPEARS